MLYVEYNICCTNYTTRDSFCKPNPESEEDESFHENAAHRDGRYKQAARGGMRWLPKKVGTLVREAIRYGQGVRSSRGA